MYFSRETLEIGGEIVVPDSIVTDKPGLIYSLTPAGINVHYHIDGPGKPPRHAFYSYDWLNYQYGSKCDLPTPKTDYDDMNDEVPF